MGLTNFWWVKICSFYLSEQFGVTSLDRLAVENCWNVHNVHTNVASLLDLVLERLSKVQHLPRRLAMILFISTIGHAGLWSTGKSLMSRGSSSRPESMNPRHMKLVAEGLLLGVAENHCLRGISRNMLCDYFTSGSRFLSQVLKFFWCIKHTVVPKIFWEFILCHLPRPVLSFNGHLRLMVAAIVLKATNLRDGQGIIPEPSVEAAKEQVNQVMKTQWIDVDCNVSKEQVAKGIELPPQTCANFHSTGCQFGAPQRLFMIIQCFWAKVKTQSNPKQLTHRYSPHQTWLKICVNHFNRGSIPRCFWKPVKMREFANAKRLLALHCDKELLDSFQSQPGQLPRPGQLKIPGISWFEVTKITKIW